MCTYVLYSRNRLFFSFVCIFIHILGEIIDYNLGLFSIFRGLYSQAAFSTQVKQGFLDRMSIIYNTPQLHTSNFKLHKHIEEKIFCTFEAIEIEHKSCYDNWFLCPQEMSVGMYFNHMTQSHMFSTGSLCFSVFVFVTFK